MDSRQWVHPILNIWRVYRDWTYSIYVQSDGSWESLENDDKNDNMWDFKLRHNGESWLIEATTKVKPS